MRRAIPWVLLAALLTALAAIRADFEGLKHPIIFLGDSITERASLPKKLAGKRVVNAGIGGATIAGMNRIAPKIFEGVTPYLIVVALGTNDRDSPTIRSDFSNLLTRLAEFSPNLIAVGSPSSHAVNEQIRIAARTAGIRFIEPDLTEDCFEEDGIHLSPAGYRVWIPFLLNAIK
jgi:lysophospholipase L1-like esterase